MYLIDTSAILSGKPFYNQMDSFMTAPLISDEFTPGGRDYNLFQLLKQKGLQIRSPKKESRKRIVEIVKNHGEYSRLSDADCELLALALEVKNEKSYQPVILTDDYAMQNIANALNISFQSLSQKGITKRFKWQSRCRGCGRIVDSTMKDCPICGSDLVQVVVKKHPVNKQKRDQ